MFLFSLLNSGSLNIMHFSHFTRLYTRLLYSYNIKYPVQWTIFFFSLGLYPWHIEVPRLGIKSELQLPTTATASATRDLSRVCYLHHSSWQCRILNPLSRPGIKPSSSCILVRFISTELWWEGSLWQIF